VRLRHQPPPPTAERWAAGEQPLLPLAANSTSWPPPPPPTCVSTSGACPGTPYNASRLHLGDWRVRIEAPPGLAGSEVLEMQVFWRRRDHGPVVRIGMILQRHVAAGAKRAGYTADHAGGAEDVPLVVKAATRDCAVLRFRVPPAPADFEGNQSLFLYPMPYYQYGEFEGTINMHYLNCTEPRGACAPQSAPSSGDPCATLPAAGGRGGATAVAIENRPNPPGSAEGGHGHGNPALTFPGRMPLELTATAVELAALTSPAAARQRALMVWLEPRENGVRFLGEPLVPAAWARSGERHALQASARAGEFFTFQVGLFAPGAAVTGLALEFAPLLTAAGGSTIPAAAWTCFNFEGKDETGAAFTKNFSLPGGQTSVLWVGVQLPAVATAVGKYTSSLTLRADDASVAVPLRLELDVELEHGRPVPYSGDADVYNMGRLRWLNSDLGIDESVTHPFTNITVAAAQSHAEDGVDGPIAFVVQLVNKNISIGATGLPVQVAVKRTVTRRGHNITRIIDVFADAGGAPRFSITNAVGAAVSMRVTRPATVVNHTASSAAWLSIWDGGGITATLTGTIDFDSYATFTLDLQPSDPSQDASIGGMEFSFVPAPAIAQFMCGLGTDAASLRALNWTWDHIAPKGNNRVWIGRPDAGVYFHMRGPEALWEAPYPSVPYIPAAWSAGSGGARVASSGAVTAFSGAQNVSGGAQIVFDLAFTPSKPLDLRSHWQQRYLQIGYGVPYTKPQNVSRMGATVATLHQGIVGVHNGTMVNPYSEWWNDAVIGSSQRIDSQCAVATQSIGPSCLESLISWPTLLSNAVSLALQ
jgi:hypothetical protein